MKLWDIAAHFLIALVVAFAVSVIIIWLYDLLYHGSGAFHWARSLFLALVISLSVSGVEIYRAVRSRPG